MPHPISDEQREILKKIGERVQMIRNEKGLSLQDVALRIGKDKQSIHRLEKGSISPSVLYLLEVCDGLEIKITELLEKLDK